MVSRTLLSIAAASLLLMLPGEMPLFAQTQTGQIAGIVYDQAGARLDQASVIIRNAATGAESNASPDMKGEYHVENLPAGKYSLRASAKGLTSVEIDDVSVQPNKTTRVNVTLPEARSTPISVVEVAGGADPQEIIPPKPATASQPLPPAEDAKTVQEQVLNPKAILNEINSLRERLALSLQQQTVMQAILQERQEEIAAARLDQSLTLVARRDRIKAVRAQAETKFLAILTDNQRDEYQEIVRERRERAAQRKQDAAAAASH